MDSNAPYIGRKECRDNHKQLMDKIDGLIKDFYTFREEIKTAVTSMKKDVIDESRTIFAEKRLESDVESLKSKIEEGAEKKEQRTYSWLFWLVTAFVAFFLGIVANGHITLK